MKSSIPRLVMLALVSFFVIYVLFSQLPVLKENLKFFKDWAVDQTLSWRHGLRRDRNLMVAMRDDTLLRTHVLLPLDYTHKSLPTILMRTTYQGFSFEWSKFFVDHGYAVVQQYTRGRYGSEGRYSPHSFSRDDGYDTIEWITTQPWSNGKVGTFGCSYLGETQVLAAATRHPAHRAMIADGAGGAIGSAEKAYGYFGVYENGILNLASALGWFVGNGAQDVSVTPEGVELSKRIAQELAGLPVNQLSERIVPYRTEFDQMLDHELTSPWWRQVGYLDDADQFSTAALHVNTWYDQTVHGTFRTAKFMAQKAVDERAKHQRVIIGPGNHCSTDNLSMGKIKIGEMEVDYTPLDFPNLYLSWFDQWLKFSLKDDLPAYRYFLVHANRWLESDVWPPAKTELTSYFLSDNNRLKLVPPEQSGDITFAYDPMNPVPTKGGAICCTGRSADISGAVDQSQLRARDDVLYFQSDFLFKDMTLTGHASVGLWVSSSAVDTDFTFKLIDVYPDGKSYNVVDSASRIRYRNGIEKPELIRSGDKVFIKVESPPMAYVIKAGHRIELQISSSNFPRLARNLNTGRSEYGDDQFLIAENTVFWGKDQASYIKLPVFRDFSD